MRCISSTACAVLGLAMCGTASADTLNQQLTAFVRQTLTIPYSRLDVEIKRAPAQIPACPNPQFSLPAGTRQGGPVSVRMRCEERRYFIPVDIQITGRYPVAARTIAAGQHIEAQDIQWREGRIDRIYPPPLLDEAAIIGAVSLREIGTGQVVNDNVLRAPWAVASGQVVRVIIKGPGFSVSSQGKAMNNAALKAKIRLRLSSGKAIEGTVSAVNEVTVIRY